MLLDIKVPPFNSTLMGVIRGVADYYGLKPGNEMLYGLSGHAFMINIHDVICPSSPYCWNRTPFYKVLRNIGISMEESGFYSESNTKEEREKIEAELVKRLDDGKLCGLLNLEYQLITGYDETGFITTHPWPMLSDFPPRHLTFSSWEEIKNEIHVSFFTFEKTDPVPEKDAVIASLKYALDICDNPAGHTGGDYHAGLEAFDAWIKAVETGHGAGHGNWWNGMVWSECRQHASGYFGKIAERYPVTGDIAVKISSDYKNTANILQKISDKNLDAAEKVKLLKEAKTFEHDCIENIRSVLALL